jgi:hypothetical protein
MKRGTFTSVWDDGIEISSPAELDEETGEVIVLETADVNGLDMLMEETFTDTEGKQYPICPSCHCFIVKTEMVERIGKQLVGRTGCTDPNCDNTIEQY